MSTTPQSFDWTQTLKEIDEDSPYTYTVIDGEIELFIPGTDEEPTIPVGTLHSPADWQHIRHDVERFGIWPAGISF